MDGFGLKTEVDIGVTYIRLVDHVIAVSQELAQSSGLEVIASGGVSGLEDIRQVQQAGLAGVIVGRALYEGSLALEEALLLEGK